MTTSIPLVIAPRRLGRVAGLMVVLWTLALAASVGWNMRLLRKTMLQVATQEARTSCNKDLHYLLNPAYMTRQVHAMKAQEDDVIGHITSLKPLRPENAPDAWEAAALRACQSGQTEVVSRELLHGRRFLRYLKPLVTTASCLKCHTNQGYKAGEPNGGISVAVPLDPYLALAQAELWPMGEVHIGLWVLGVLGIGLGARQMRQRLDQQLQAAAALRESEDRFRTVADFTVAMEYWRLPDGSLAYMSPSCERLTGYSAAEFLQAPELLASIVHSEDRPRVKGHFSDASETRAGPEQRELEFRIRTRSGETRWIGHVCQPVVDREGKFQGIRVSNRDLTDRKQVAEVLRTSEAKHRLLFESAGDAIFIHDEAGRILAVNPSACERLGYTHAELMAIMISQVDSPAEAPHAPERIARLMAQGQLTFETAHQRKDGSSVWTEVSARRITWDGQSAMMSICRDITERKRTAAALRAAALYARNLIETSLDPLVTISAEGKVTDVNAATEKITGASREKLIGSDFADYFTEPERARAGYLKVFAQGQVIDYPLALRHSSGAITNVLYNAAVYRNEQGEVLGVFAAARDVTARQQAEAALRSREERLSFLLSSTPVVIYTCRATGDFGATFLSENVPSLLGHRAIDFVEDPTFWVQHIHPADVQRVFAGLSTLSVQDSHTHEYRLRHQDGTYRWMHDQVRVVRDAAGHPTMLIGSWLDITERKQAETALRESETNLNRAQAIAHIGSWSLDVARDILDWSAETRRIFGVAPETPLTYRSFLTCLHPDDQARVDRAWQAALPGTPYDIEHRIIVENQVKWVRERAELEAGADGNVRRGLGTVQDITERKLAEAALQESEEKYRVLVETTNTGFLILNNEGKVIDANAEYVRLTGHSELGDILGKTVIEWTADYDQQRNAAAVAQCVKVGFVKNFVTDYVGGNGRITPIEVNAAIIGTGESMRIVSLCRDITERKQAAEELRRSEERYRSILNATPDAVAIMDTAGRVVMISPGTVAMFGYQRAEELLGKWVTDFIVPEERARAALNVGLIFQGQSPGLMEYRCLRADGSLFDVEANGEVIRDAAGQHVQMVAIVRDITERKQTEAALRENELKYRSLFETSEGAILLFADNRWVDCNTKALSIYGGTRDQIIGAHPSRFSPPMQPDGRPSEAEAIKKINLALAVGPQVFEWEHCRVDGTPFTAEVSLNRLALDGKPQIQAIVRDITERKLAEAALRESEERFRNLLRDVPGVAVQGYRLDGTTTYWNQASEALYGYTAQDAVGRSLLDLVVPPEMREDVRQAMRQMAETGQPIPASELSLMRKDGSRVAVFSSHVVVQIPGRAAEMFWLDIDLTKRKRAETALRESETKFKSMVDTLPLAIYLSAGVDQISEYVSPTMVQLFGYTQADIPSVAQWWPLAYPDETYRQQVSAEWTRKVKRAMETQSPMEPMEAIVTCKDGSKKDISWGFITLGDKNYAFGLDLTSRKQAEAALRESEDRFRGVVEGAAMPIFVTVGMKFSYLNPAALRLLGATTPEQVLGQPILSRIHPDCHASIQKRAVKVFQGQRGAAPPQAEVYLKLDGTPVPVEATASPITYQGQSAAVVFVQDITERKRLKDSLRELNRSLERRVAERTTELSLEIAERRQTEERLRASEQRHRDLVETVPDWVWQVDEHGIYTFSGPQSRDLLGYAPEEILGRTFFDFMPPEEAQRVRSFTLSAMMRGEPIQVLENVLRRKDGGLITVETNGVPIRDAAGELRGYRGLDHDITERRQAAQTLRRSELKFRTLFEATGDAVMLLDEKGFFDCNEAALRVMGCASQAEICALHAADLSPPQQPCGTDSWTLAQARIVAAQTKGSQHFEWVHRRADTGESFPADVTLTALQLEGRPVLQAVVRDTTDRKQAEIEHAAIITTALEGFFIVDFEGRIQEVNDAYCRMSGYSRAELLTRRVSELEAEDTVQDIQQRTAKIIAQGHDQFESRHRRQDGSTFDIAVSVQFSFMRGGVLICFLQDITERKQAEAAMHAAKAAADAANLAKSRFLANMSHEIRTPMNAILGFSQLLLRDMECSGRCQPEYVGTILRSGEHLLSIINDILEMARIESGRLTLNPAPFDLDRLLEDLARMLSLRVQTKQLRFQVERQGEVPRYLLADETKLRQVLINLLGNAVKFTPNGGAITLRVRSEPEPDGALRLHVEVADTGLGIAPEDVPQLFEPFFQTHDGQSISGGTGLGLPISREFVRLMGGEFEVTSQVGVGSTFRFDVRVSRAQGTAAGAERPSAHGSLRLPPGQPACRVLVVDDQPENRQLLMLLLAPVGFEIRTAADGAEAVAQCQEWVPHLVLMDLRMTGMDGYEATRRLRAAHGTTVKIIALSASVFIEDRQRAVAEGADAFLAKPFDHADLLDRIKELVGVDYVYDALPEAAATVHAEAATERPSAGEMRRLPADLLAALREATCRADYQQMLTLVEQAATHDERLGRLLRQLVKRFDHDTLLELLAAHTPNL